MQKLFLPLFYIIFIFYCTLEAENIYSFCILIIYRRRATEILPNTKEFEYSGSFCFSLFHPRRFRPRRSDKNKNKIEETCV